MNSFPYYIYTLGCQMNYSDSERIATILDSIGGYSVDGMDYAKVVIINSCSVRKSAEDRVYGQMRYFLKRKKSDPSFTVILTGCMASYDSEKMEKKLEKGVDSVLSIKEIYQLPYILSSRFEKRIKEEKPQVAIEDYFSIPPKYQSKFRAYIPIMTGCNKFCTYCIVPFTRGREISRPSQLILKKCKDLIRRGYREIFLLGQSVNSYGNDQKDELSFTELLRRIAQIPGDFWIRFTSVYPPDVTEDLVLLVANEPKIAKSFHLPLQSGDDEILRRMARRYTVEDFFSILGKLRKALPDISISTDIIVGFPGETEKHFENTRGAFMQAQFDMAYINQFSPRPKTPAMMMKDDVSIREKHRRENILNTLLKKYALSYHKKFKGKTTRVLVEKVKNRSSLCVYSGKNSENKTVQFLSGKIDLVGKFQDVMIKEAASFGMKGKLLS